MTTSLKLYDEKGADSKEYRAGLFIAMYDELSVHKSNNKKRSLNE